MPKSILYFLLVLSFSGTYAEQFSTAIPMNEKGTATYFIHAHVGNESVELLVDTGAGYATLNRDLINKLKHSGEATHVGEIEGILANGEICILPVYRISSFILGGCLIENIEVAETPPNARNLLGLSVLKKAAPFTFSLEPAELSLSNCNNSASETMAQSEDRIIEAPRPSSGLSSLY